MHASIYVPISIPATKLPQYVNLDRNSQWQISAVLSAALETMTLPSRLRAGEGKRGFLDDLEAALNVNGNQRIAQLQCSVLDPDTKVSLPTVRRTTDERIRSDISNNLLAEDAMHDAKANLDMDFSGAESNSSAARQSLDHVFGAVECLRGNNTETNGEEMDEDDINYSRKRQRLAGLAVRERYYTTLPYPTLDSFPEIFTIASPASVVGVHTSLATSTGISRRIKALQKTNINLIGLDEREALSNGLSEMGEAYEKGWQSGSDEGSDD